MTYPLSSPVIEGQATEAAQYNNLRSDALFLGGDPSASGSVRDLLLCGGSYSLVQEGKTTIKLPASENEPVGMMIGGGIYSVNDNVTLTISSITIPAAGRYSIYAVGAAGTFSLALSTGNHSREIGTFCWDGSGIIPGTLHTTAENATAALIKKPGAAAGRLSLAAGDPMPDTDISLGSTLYFIPYKGAEIGLYLFGKWEYFDFSVLSLGNSGLTREIPYDVFLSVDSDGLQLTASPWESISARASGTLAWQDGIRVSGADASKRYLGSFVLNSSGYFEDSAAGRLLINENNRIMRPVLKQISTSKTGGTAHINLWAPYYDEDAPFVRLLVPNSDVEFELEGIGIGTTITENDFIYGRYTVVGILQDPMLESPYTGNLSCVPVYTHSFGNTPMTVRVENNNSGFTGYHAYYLGFYSNYSFTPQGTSYSGACGEIPGIIGKIMS